MNRLQGKRRALAISFTAVSLFSFFAPLVDISPPVLGNSRWSIFEAVRQLQAGRLAVKSGDALPGLFLGFGIPYVLILMAFISACFFPVQKLFGWIGAIGAFLGLETLRFNWDLKRLFYGPFAGHESVSYPALVFLLTSVMLILCFISWNFQKHIKPEEAR